MLCRMERCVLVWSMHFHMLCGNLRYLQMQMHRRKHIRYLRMQMQMQIQIWNKDVYATFGINWNKSGIKTFTPLHFHMLMLGGNLTYL